MLYQAPIGDITFYTTPLPRRYWSRGVFITTRYSNLYVAIQTASNPAQARAVARQTLLELTPLYEGVSIIAFLEKALSTHNPSSSKEDEKNKMPITMDELEDILDARGLVVNYDINNEVELTKMILADENYAFDICHYDTESKKLLWLHMAYGLADQPKRLEEWKQRSLDGNLHLLPLFKQYYGKDIKSIEFACIDPLLKHSQKETGIWSLKDADKFTGTPGTAEKIASWQKHALNDLNMVLSRPNAPDEEKRLQQLIADIKRIVHSSNKNVKLPNLSILTPE